MRLHATGERKHSSTGIDRQLEILTLGDEHVGQNREAVHLAARVGVSRGPDGLLGESASGPQVSEGGECLGVPTLQMAGLHVAVLW